MPLYIFDASAIIALEEACATAGHDFEDVADALTDLAMKHEMSCPPVVLRQCREYGEGEAGTRWLKSVSGHFVGIADPWEYLETVLAACPSLIDPDDPNESPQATVLAMALFKKRTRPDVVLVTDQWVDMPTRIALGSAARLVGVSAISPDALISSLSGIL